ncbi:MAG: hypothetical protein ACLP07_15820 [Terracidiphilus sp.]
MTLANVALTFGVEDVIVLDTEYVSSPGEHVVPVCLCAQSIVTGRKWKALYEPGSACSLPLTDNILYVAYSAPAEWSYFLAAGWDLPLNILDLYAEFALLVNGLLEPKTGARMGTGLLRALEYFGVQTDMGKEEKQLFRNLILRGAPYTRDEQEQILDYCWSDVANTILLLEAMLPKLVPAQALNRGDFTRAVAWYEYNGIPVDMALHNRLRENWTKITAGLAMKIEEKFQYGVYSLDRLGQQHWSDAGLAKLVERRGLADVWPKTGQAGKYRTGDPERGGEDDKVFKTMAQLDPYFEPLRQTKKLLSTFKRFEIPVGRDGRCRAGNIPFSQRTGRSSPKGGSIFALTAWARWLIKPAPGRAVAYVDLVSAEFGVAAALSRDPVMLKLYIDMINGIIEDVYLEIAKMSKAAPSTATKESHPEVRKLWKPACLAAQYDAMPERIAKMTNCSLSVARGIHYTHHHLFRCYWDYIDTLKVEAQAAGVMKTRGGWMLRTAHQKEGTLGNFPVQAHCAEVMRLAASYMVAEGIRLCTTVHDAVLIEDSVENINHAVETARACWRKASLEVIGFELDADAKIVRHPNRYEDKDGKEMFHLLLQLLDEAERNQQSVQQDSSAR